MSALTMSQEIQDVWDKQVHELDDNEIQIIQESRSEYRKNRYQKLPILISILNEIHNSSNLADLANRYDKCKLKKKTESQREEEYQEIMKSVTFSQTKNKTNPYQKSTFKSSVQEEKKSVQVQEEQQKIEPKKTQIEEMVEMLENTSNNIQNDLIKISQENADLEYQINSYFDKLWTSTTGKNRQLNAQNYNLKDRQSYYQDVQISIIPILEQEKHEAMIKQQIQEQRIQQLEEQIETLNPIQQIYKDQEDYIMRLKLAYQQIGDETVSLKANVEKLKQAQQIMQLELKLEEFCNKLLEFQQRGKQKAIVEVQELIKSQKIKMLSKYKEKSNKSFIGQDTIEIDEDNLEELVEELSQNKTQVEKKQKIANLQKQINDKKSKIKEEQMRIGEENNLITNYLNNISQDQLSQRLKDLQQQIDESQEIFKHKESEFEALEQQVQAAQLMEEDLKQKKDLYANTTSCTQNRASAIAWFKRLLSH